MIRAQKAQSATEFALGLTFVALLVFALVALIGRPVPAEASLPPMDMDNPHPEEKHGMVTNLRINACFDNNGTMMTLMNHTTGRRADLCKLPDGQYGVRISESNGNGGLRIVSQFLKEKMKMLEDVLRYLSNRGYTPVQ